MKKEKKTEITKEKILAAAIEEFGTKGYRGASLNNICNTGISKGLIYHNYKNKDDLYLTCVEKCFSSLTAYLQEKQERCDIYQYMNKRLAFFSENRNYTKIFFEAVLQPPKNLSVQIKVLKKGLDALNQRIYRSALTCVSLRPGVTEDDAMNYFELVQEMFNGYFSSPAYHDLPFSDMIARHEAMLLKLLDFMLYGIAEKEVE